MDLEKWLADWTACVDGIFGERIRFLGIQGSYGRGEATAESDIDVVLLLDGLQLEDLQTYDEAVSALPMREKLCGFVGGWEELIHWDKADLFQFIQDTRALRGSLDDLWHEITKEDIQRAVHKGACDLYHGCVHNFLHEKDGEMLKAFYKSAVFVVQAMVYLQKGVYGKKRTDLEQMAEGMDTVHFLGSLSDADLRAALQECDFLVLPSVANSEAFGLVQLEAMVYGKPVINTALPTGVPHVSLDGETGLTVPPESETALAKAMQTLVSDADLRSKYGAAAKKRVETVFAEDVVMQQVYDVLADSIL